MPLKDKEITKLYYSIGEVAELMGVAPSQIRFWEREFDILKPKKNRKGNRLFVEADLQNLKLIYHLLKEKRYTIDGAKSELKSKKQKLMDKVEVVDKLEQIRNFLKEIRDTL
ncbi:MAG: MerR family transcriptional regulator [Sphingobacteriales bacterium]|nr:MerR family transcriptional regulator [Sphingobacteriales bacterium]